MAAVALCAAADALSADAINRVPPVAREFKYEDGRTIYPSYRTWDFEVDEPGLYVFDVVSPDAKTRPAVREWLDGTQIAFSFVGKDYAEKADAHGRLRRFRWLEPGIHTLDLYLNVGGYPWDDEMEKAMNAKGVKVLLYRPADGEFGFWMEGTDPDCMARLMGEPLVVAGCAANVSRKFTIEVSDGWSQTLAVSNAPVIFEYPCDKEGAFEYVVRDDKGEVVEGPWDFVVTDIGRKEQTDLLTPNGVRGTVSRVSDEQIRVLNKTAASSLRDPVLVDRVDCTEGAGGEHLFREGGKSEIVETPDGAYRLCGPHGVREVFRRQNVDGKWRAAKKGEKGAQARRAYDWFAYTLKVAHPGKSHALVVRVPNDVRRFTSVVAYDRRTLLSNAWGIDSGDAPAAGPWSEMKIPVWPNSDAIDVMVINTDGRVNSHIPHPNRRGAAAELSLVEYLDGFPTLEAAAMGWNAVHEFGWGGEQIDLGPNERTMPPLSDAAAALVCNPPKEVRKAKPYRTWNDILIAWDRTFELETWRGGTTFVYPVYSYGMVTFHGRAQMIAPPGNDVYAQNCYGNDGERNPFDRDVFALMLQRAQKHGVKIFADLMIQRTYPPVVAAWAGKCGMEGATNGFYLSATADGKPFRLRPIYAGLPNPAHPVARRIQVEFCREMGRRYGKYSSFGGMSHRFSKAWPPSFEPWFHDGELGFDDFTVGEFSKATGITLDPVGNDTAAFDARKKRIREEFGQKWNAWRTEVCQSLHEEMLAAMREGAPQARFYVGSSKVFDADSGLDPAAFCERREFGFDAAQVRIKGPGVEINGLDPIHFGNFWLHKQNLPPPTGLCCNSSYRCSPYHLEPAALALAENKLDQLWAGGQWCLPPLDDALREFVRAYRAIPDRDDWQKCSDKVGDKSSSSRNEEKFHSPTPTPNSNSSTCSTRLNSPVAVWWAKDGNDVLFWAVNRTDASRRVVLTFDKEPSALVDCVTGNPVNPVKKTQSEISLAPFMPGVFRAKGAGSLVVFEVPVDPEETARIEKDFAFIASTANNVAITSAVEIGQGVGETYFAPAGALGKRDCRWSFSELFSPMREAHDAGDFHSLRALVADFKTNHRWWFEAFGWPDDFCVRRNVGRLPLVGFLRQGKPTEMWFGDTNGLFTANFSEKFPQCKKDFVCAPQGVALDILRHGQPGGFRQLELSALFGGGYGDIRVEDEKGDLIGIISRKERKEERLNQEVRLETRVLSVPIPNPGHRTHVRLVGTGGKGLAIYALAFTALPPEPITAWQVIGPFDKGGGEKDKESYLKTFPPETDPFDANASFAGMGGETVRWKTVTLGLGERVVNVAAATPCDVSRCNAVTYLRTTIRAPRRMPTMLRYCNDYYGKIWLNGKPIVPAMRGPSQKYEGVEVTLQKGENVILVKTSPGGAGTWHFGMAVNDFGGLEIEEAK